MEIKQTPTFSKWLSGLRDRQARLAVLARMERIKDGLFGDAKPVGGVYEMRIHYGPGYRLYFIKHGATVIVLLCGGDKSSQSADIAKAKKMAADL